MSVTTVPIRPIKKGSLSKYWAGIIIVILAAGALAWIGTADLREKYQTNEQFLAQNAKADGVETTPSGLQIKTLRAGEGKSPTNDDVALIRYKGTLRDGTVFDQNEQAPLEVDGVVPGFSEALKKMQKGGEYQIWIPSDLAYGPDDRTNPQTGEVVMKGGSLLIFDITLLDFQSKAVVEEMRKAAAAQQKAQGGSPGGASGLPADLQRQLEEQLRAQGQ